MQKSLQSKLKTIEKSYSPMIFHKESLVSFSAYLCMLRDRVILYTKTNLSAPEKTCLELITITGAIKELQSSMDPRNNNIVASLEAFNSLFYNHFVSWMRLNDTIQQNCIA